MTVIHSLWTKRAVDNFPLWISDARQPRRGDLGELGAVRQPAPPLQNEQTQTR